ncbi:MAG: hypothetical protein ACYTFV_19185 [Planctomycetota bacterium]|jgi:hypothetical protein
MTADPHRSPDDQTPRPCPACGGVDVVPIVYGLPGPELAEASGRGEYELGGCLIGPDMPGLACRGCGFRFAPELGPMGPGGWESDGSDQSEPPDALA